VQIDERTDPCHWMLLRLAGRIPDGLLAQSREWLAQGRLPALADSLTHAVVSTRVRLSPDDLDLLAELHGDDAGGAPSSLLSVETTDVEPMPFYGFAAEPPEPASGQRSTPQSVAPESVAQAIVAAAADTGAVRAIWRSWRFPMENASWPPPRQVFVVEVEEDVELAAITAGLQDALTAVGEIEPQVEVYPTQTEPPTYQQLARSCGELLWARDPDPGIRIAAIFDEVDEQTGPRLHVDHPKVDSEEQELLLGYLSRGALLMESPSGMADVWDSSAGPVVPISFRTDGYWIWSDATTYYLYEYGLAPEPAFLEHLRARRYEFGQVDGAAMYRALAVLERPLPEEPVWQLE
jgi:hypothetical protein